MGPPPDEREAERDPEGYSENSPPQGPVVEDNALSVEEKAKAQSSDNIEDQGTDLARKLISAEWCQVAVNLILAIIGVWALVIYAGQLTEMQESTKAATKAANAAEAAITLAKDNAHLDQRAWVAVTKIVGTPTEGNPFIVTITVTNNGKTFAKKFHMVSYNEEVPINLPVDIGPSFADDDGTWDNASTSILAPNGAKESKRDILGGTPDNEIKVTRAQLDEWKSAKRTKTFFVSGKLVYEDIFGCEHWMTFSAFLERDLSWVYYSKHNDADDNRCDEN